MYTLKNKLPNLNACLRAWPKRGGLFMDLMQHGVAKEDPGRTAFMLHLYEQLLSNPHNIFVGGFNHLSRYNATLVRSPRNLWRK